MLVTMCHREKYHKIKKKIWKTKPKRREKKTSKSDLSNYIKSLK